MAQSFCSSSASFRLAVQIDAVAARVLRNDDQFFYAAVRQILRFFNSSSIGRLR